MTTKGAGLFQSLWKAAGLPAAGSNPPAFGAGSGYVPTDATVGALGGFTNPTAPAKTNLLQAALSGTIAGTLILYDRLWACSGFGTVITTAQNTVTPGALTRPDAFGEGAELWAEVYTAPGATAASWTVSYTNSANPSPVAGRSAVYAHPASAEVIGQMMPIALQAGDTGISSIQSFTASASSGTAGDIGLTILRRITSIPIMVANVAAIYEAISLAMPPVNNDACIGLMVQCTAATSGLLLGSFKLGQG